MSVPELRLRTVHDAPARPDGDFVLYWMIAHRRLGWNFALQRAVDEASRLDKPLVILEALRCGYRWASDRLHRFVIDGMADHARQLDGSERQGVVYYPYLEPEADAGKGLLEALAERAALVVTDDFPCFFLPRLVEAAGRQLARLEPGGLAEGTGVRLEAVDANGLLPLRAADKVFARAFDFRRFLQKNLPSHLGDLPRVDPLSLQDGGPGLPPLDAHQLDGIEQRWPPTPRDVLDAPADLLARLPIDHDVRPWDGLRGGDGEAAMALQRFLDERLASYGDGRNHPDDDAASGFSPYLHFGHLGAHQVFTALAEREGWTPQRLSDTTRGQREGWWGMSASAESFLDELVTWREVGYNMCWQEPAYDRYDSLPDWARATLAEHQGDEREHVYTLEQFERAETHDELWNAAQRQLVKEGRMHNYLRMLWGKKVLHWTEDPRTAVDILVELNNKYALDGRNPNSYSGIFWVFGRYDRAWGPERPIFGKIRYMTSDSTRRKLRLTQYLQRYGSANRSLW